MLDIAELPFPLGSTASAGLATIDATVLQNLEGMEYIVRDTGIDGNRDSQGTGRVRRIRLVKNNSGFALQPKRCCLPANFGRYAAGYGTVADGDEVFVVDDQLPAAGVADQDHFYVSLAGPTLCITDLAAGTPLNINPGDPLASVGGATSGAATAGHVKLADFTLTGTTLARILRNWIGTAGSTKTSANTNQDILVDLRWK